MARSRTCGHLGVGQGVVGGLEAQAEGQAALAGVDARAAVDVEQLEIGQQLPARHRRSRVRTAAAGTSSAATKARSMSLEGNRLTGRHCAIGGSRASTTDRSSSSHATRPGMS